MQCEVVERGRPRIGRAPSGDQGDDPGRPVVLHLHLDRAIRDELEDGPERREIVRGRPARDGDDPIPAMQPGAVRRPAGDDTADTWS